MIQRIQSLFLLGIVILSIGIFFVPFGEKISVDYTPGETSLSVLTVQGTVQNNVATVLKPENYAILVFNIVILLIAGITIFLYKNRKLQIRLCSLGGLVVTINLVLIFYCAENMVPVEVKTHFLPGIYMATVQLVLFLAARKYIANDEKLVRAADRIR